MLFRTHVAFAVLVFFILNLVLEIPTKIYFLAFVLIGAIIVDIDMKKSKAGKGWYLRPLQFFTKHRGFFHSFIFGILVAVLIASWKEWLGVGFFAGFCSHIFLDLTTESGVRLFWSSKQRVGLGIRSGGIIEEIIFVLILIVDVVWAVGLG